MAQRLLNVRVRPARVAVLINQAAEQRDLLLAFEFLSKIWGGRFGQILAVDPKACDSLTEYRLSESRPDYIYGIGLDDGDWAKAVLRACQPRGYGALKPEFVKNLKQHHSEDYYLVDHALIHLFRTRDQKTNIKRVVRLVTPDQSSTLSLFCAAVFGVHHRDLNKAYFDEETRFQGSTAQGLIELATTFIKDWQQSWLDVTGHELNLRVMGPALSFGQLPPTVVLVRDQILDLSLFWNLRTATEADAPAWILPIPAEGCNEQCVLGGLKEWLLASFTHRPGGNYCQVTSQSVGEVACQEFAGRFQQALEGTRVEAVDYVPPRNNLPVVIPYEYETTWAVDIKKRRLKFIPPKPKAFESLDSSRTWYVDLRRDSRSGRAVKDLQLPSSPVVQQLLNGPCPPQIEHSVLPRTGDGVDCINVRCSDKKEVISVYLPTSAEILSEILLEHGVEPLHDEKRSGYLPVIRRFGGLYVAGSAFSGKSGAVLTALEKGPMTLAEIKGTCQLGSGTLPGQTYLSNVEDFLRPLPERMKRIGRQRFARYIKNQAPENLKLSSVVEHWAERSILNRKWKIGPCPSCRRVFFETHLDIQERVLCPSCGNRIGLRESVTLGYCLDPTVGLAIEEGIIPVVLTGRFLRGMTHLGFFWLPGVKYQIGDTKGDIDALACCDGHLVFCECKQLDQTKQDSETWNKVATQFLETAAVAKRCQGSLAVLAALVDSYPDEIKKRIEGEIAGTIPILFLDKLDLEKGRRDGQDEENRAPVRWHELLPARFPEKPRPLTGKPRKMSMGWTILTS